MRQCLCALFYFSIVHHHNHPVQAVRLDFQAGQFALFESSLVHRGVGYGVHHRRLFFYWAPARITCTLSLLCFVCLRVCPDRSCLAPLFFVLLQAGVRYKKAGTGEGKTYETDKQDYRW
jgi:hypothetical protein